MNAMFANMSMPAFAQRFACAAFSCPEAANGMIIIMDASLLLASIFVLSIALPVLLSLLADSCSERRAA